MLNIKLGFQRAANETTGKSAYSRRFNAYDFLHVLPLGFAGWGVIRYQRIEVEPNVLDTELTLHCIAEDRDDAIDFAVKFPLEELKNGT